ncbi:MAG: hypothetical protein EOO57_01700 [Hymenobacter sp.]|nr:MAG: hypothetical protein EOO57_01700 [Hymenobacter sp.]
MNAEERLNQFEPLLAETMAILDRHTAQLKQLSNAVAQNTQVLIQQSDNISFLLQGYIVVKDDVATLKIDVAELKIDVAELKTDVAELKNDVATLKTDVAEMRLEFGSKLDLILSKLR